MRLPYINFGQRLHTQLDKMTGKMVLFPHVLVEQLQFGYQLQESVLEREQAEQGGIWTRLNVTK